MLDTNVITSTPAAPTDISGSSIADLKAMISGESGTTIPETQESEESKASSEAAKPAAEIPAEESDPSKTAQEQKTEELNDDAELETPKGLKKRFSKLTKTIRDLEAKLAQKDKPAAAAEVKTEVATPAKAMEPAGKPVLENFETHEAYVEALTDWKLDQREAARVQTEQATRAQEEQRAKATKWQERLTDARKQHADFDEVALGEVPCSAAMRDVIFESEQGPELAYWLGSNPKAAERIAGLSPLAAARELGRIEGKLTVTEPVKPAPAAAKPLPKPPTPVDTPSRAKAEDLSDPNLPLSEFKRIARSKLSRANF